MKHAKRESIKEMLFPTKRYYIPGVDHLNQMVETDASRAKTERARFIWTMIVSCVSALAAIIAAVFAGLTAFAR